MDKKEGEKIPNVFLKYACCITFSFGKKGGGLWREEKPPPIAQNHSRGNVEKNPIHASANQLHEKRKGGGERKEKKLQSSLPRESNQEILGAGPPSKGVGGFPRSAYHCRLGCSALRGEKEKGGD